MKYILIALAFLLPLHISSGIRERTIHPRQYETYRLIGVESSWNPNAISHKGAIGLAQITTNCLSHFNWRNRKQILPSQLKDPEVNLMIAHWYLDYLEDFFSNHDEPERSILMYSSYNMGQYRTRYDTNKRYYLVYRDYVRKISPMRYIVFKTKNKLIWRGKNIDLWQLDR
jgi:soluble lytic murein transglycosylase-like protein